MDKGSKNYEIEGPKLYTSYSGVLLGFALTLIALLLTLSSKEIKQSPFFEYAIGAFFISSFGYLNSSEWFIKYIRDSLESKKVEEKREIEKSYEYGSYFYYLGYLSMVLGTIYLLKLFELNRIVMFFGYPALFYTFYYFVIDGYMTLKNGKGISMDTIFFPLFSIIYLVIIIVTLFSPCN